MRLIDPILGKEFLFLYSNMYLLLAKTRPVTKCDVFVNGMQAKPRLLSIQNSTPITCQESFQTQPLFCKKEWLCSFLKKSNTAVPFVPRSFNLG